MALLMAERADLAGVLEDWRLRQRLTATQLAKQSGLSRRTFYNLTNGDEITRDTLRKFARGLATDPHTGEYTRWIYGQALRDLFAAGGFPPPDDEIVVIDFDDELLRRLQDRATASEWGALTKRWPSLSPAKKASILATIRVALED